MPIYSGQTRVGEMKPNHVQDSYSLLMNCESGRYFFLDAWLVWAQPRRQAL